jgi:hypothetical protein
MSRYALKLFNNGTPNPMCIDPLACLVGQMCNYRSNKDLVSNAVSQGLHRSHYEYSRVSFARSLLGVAFFFFCPAAIIPEISTVNRNINGGCLHGSGLSCFLCDLGSCHKREPIPIIDKGLILKSKYAVEPPPRISPQTSLLTFMHHLYGQTGTVPRFPPSTTLCVHPIVASRKT